MMIQKYRAWDKVSRRMIVDEQEFIPLIVTNKGVFRLSPGHKESLYERIDNNRFETMQSTGLKDKNRAEIYEGDIVKVETRGGVVYGYAKYKSCSFMICSEDMDRIMLDCWDYEVLGNIYENPELMEV